MHVNTSNTWFIGIVKEQVAYTGAEVSVSMCVCGGGSDYWRQLDFGQKLPNCQIFQLYYYTCTRSMYYMHELPLHCHHYFNTLQVQRFIRNVIQCNVSQVKGKASTAKQTYLERHIQSGCYTGSLVTAYSTSVLIIQS